MTAKGVEKKWVEDLREELKGQDLDRLGLTDIQKRRVQKFIGGKKIGEVAEQEGIHVATVRGDLVSAESRLIRVQLGLPPIKSKKEMWGAGNSQ